MIFWQIAALAIPSAAVMGFGSWMTHRLLRYRAASAGQDNAGQETLSEVSSETDFMEHYGPMARLLDPAELNFLSSRPGYNAKLGDRLKNSRRRVFRMYLYELAGDFQRLHAAARRMIGEAPEQHADLVPVLMHQQVTFWRSMVAIEFRLAMGWAGMAPADIRPLIEMMAQLQRTVVLAAPSAA